MATADGDPALTVELATEDLVAAIVDVGGSDETGAKPDQPRLALEVPGW